MTYRSRGIKAITCLFKNKEYIHKLEECIHDVCESQNDYNLIILEVLSWKRNEVCDDDIMNNIKDKNFLYFTEQFDKYTDEINELDDFLNNPFEVDEGVLTCNKCGSNKTYSYTKQTRGGDESTTVFAMCSNCQSKWKI